MYKAILSVSVSTAAALAGGVAAAEIEQIIVTATKRELPLQETPMSVDVVTGEYLGKADASDIRDVAELAPSFSVAQSTSPLSKSYYIRRIGNLGSIPNFESAVGLFVDGAFRSRAGAALGDLFDLQQVEIVRGPQTTLHGKNTTAGLVNVVTNPPGNEFDLHGSLSTGLMDAANSVNLWQFEGVINAPISHGTSLRVGTAVYRHDDTLANLFNGDHSQDADRHTARGQLQHSNGEDLDVRLILNRFRVDSARQGDLVLFEGNAISSINEAFGVPCPDHDIDDRVFCRNHASVFDHTSSDATLNVRYTHKKLELSSISSLEDYESSRDFDADQLNIDAVRIIDRQRGSGFSQEIRLGSTGGDATGWLAGVFFLDSNFKRGSATEATAVLGADAPNLALLPGLPLGEPGDSGFFFSDSRTRHLSAFGNVDWTLTESVSLTAGLRWQTEDKRTTIVNFADHERPTAITLRLMPEFSDAALSRSTTGLSWHLGTHYRVDENWMAYALASRGFKSGGFNAGFGPTPAGSREFRDETVRNVELGIKSALLKDRMHLNASVFAARYEDFQSAGWVSLRFLVNNAERVDVSGLEVDLHALLSDRASAVASLSWVDARYGRYTNGSCYFGRQPDNEAATACDLSDRKLPQAPRMRGRIGLAYEKPLKQGAAYGRVDWFLSSKYFTNSTLDPRHVQRSYSLLNGRVGLRFDRWDISLWVRNAGDELVVMREGPSNLFLDDPAYGRAFAPPRAYGLAVRASL